MRRFRDLPIRRKATLALLATCAIVLSIACAVLGEFLWLEFRQSLAARTTVLADVLAENTRAALTFQDESDARSRLSTLRSEPNVVGARLYTANGESFAEYRRADRPALAPAVAGRSRPGADGYRFAGAELVVTRPVTLNARRLGTIELRVSLTGLRQRLRLFAFISLLVLLSSLALTAALSSALQRGITRPILELAGTAKRIAENEDFAMRATPHGDDEVGLLTGTFNRMLARVQAQLGRLELLQRITRAIGVREDLRSIFQVVVRSIEQDLPVDLCAVVLSGDTERTWTVSHVGVGGGDPPSALVFAEEDRFPVASEAAERCLRGEQAYERDTGSATGPLLQRLAAAGFRSAVLSPILVESRVFGALVAARRAPDAFEPGERHFLEQLSEHVGLATHQMQLHEALQSAYEDLRQSQQAVMRQERLRALGEMASGIAHDINNAISPIALYAELLLEEEPSLSPASRSALETIGRSVDDIAQTVARLREFSRRREPELSLKPIDLNDLVRQVIDLTRARWSDMPQQKGVHVRVSTDLEAGLPAVFGAASEIREALTNLVFNAIDAMPDGGVLTLRTCTETAAGPPPRARLVHVEVRDTGTGMDEETRGRCLEPFYTTKGERGTGLGLAMVYGIAQRHAADMEIDSELGRGTTMRLIFPAHAAAVAGAAQPAGRGARPPRARILVVDDDPLVLRSFRDLLESDGHVVEAVSGGQAGIDAFAAALSGNSPFSLVVTDLGMPTVDGRRVAAAIKAAAPSVPVVLLTGWGERLLAEGDVPPHVDRVLGKPPKLREIREALSLLLSPEA